MYACVCVCLCLCLCLCASSIRTEEKYIKYEANKGSDAIAEKKEVLTTTCIWISL